MATAHSNANRIDYLDWLRGLAVCGMFEVHCYDAWLGGSARQSAFFHWTQLSGTVPAPLFIFLSGITFALITTSMRRKGADANKIAARTIRRGAEIFALGLLFRVQEFVLGQPWAPTSDVGRVDVLNLIGLTIMAMGVVCWLVHGRLATALVAAGVAAGISMATPLVWTVWRPHWLPWYIESYFDGVHIFTKPQPWLFPLFPWSGFAFAGLAAGFFLFTHWASGHRSQSLAIVGAFGVCAFLLSQWFDSRPIHLYPVYDYWHTSPCFFLARVGLVMGVIFAGYAWCRWGLGRVGFSPLQQLGQTSLLVYWAHIEFVYGRFTILTQQAQSIWTATLGLIVIFLAMLLLSIARTKSKGRGAEILAWIRRRLPETAMGD
ncbi:MAG TPA: heparan-alpha-glucosaminide N-acetyltransferase domain-containing protein [Candidatus Aquilonibacter sp.]|nr:heparan-alpha-glucosaminide N-acetyltransferase domain-containing protein [Candidatus Aquilonibacter sp.]